MRKILDFILIRYFPLFYFNFFSKSQNNDKESELLLKYSKKYQIDKSFIEFGFDPFQFNCSGVSKNKFKGLLIDGNLKSCSKACEIFNKKGFDVKVLNHWIKLDSLHPLENFVKENDNCLGILSVDIDGNDYWVLKQILKFIKPQLIIVEYNATFGRKSISVPYKEDFERHKEHVSGWYHGASFNAFKKLLNDYYLVENLDGLNLIFISKDKIEDVENFDLNVKYSECQLRNKWSGLNADEQFNIIKSLKFEKV